MSIGQNIKKYRKIKGFTQKELAEIIGVSIQAISKWETDSGAPDISQVVPLASALDISTDTLFDYVYRENFEEFKAVKKEHYRLSTFRERKYSDKNYALLCSYFATHPQNPEVASLCLEYLVGLLAENKIVGKNKEELIAECEKYADCIFKYEIDADNMFFAYFVLSRGYSVLGEEGKAKYILQKIPINFGDRLYWEAEIAQANKEYDKAMLKCRQSFALKARYISRCIRFAGEVHEERDSDVGLATRMEYEEYMLRLINAFLSGGDYLPCRQIFQKYMLISGMVRKYIKLNRLDIALERAKTLLETREEFLNFLDAQEGKSSLLFENNDSVEYQQKTKEHFDVCVLYAAEGLKAVPDYEKNQEIMEFLRKYNLL